MHRNFLINFLIVVAGSVTIATALLIHPVYGWLVVPFILYLADKLEA